MIEYFLNLCCLQNKQLPHRQREENRIWELAASRVMVKSINLGEIFQDLSDKGSSAPLGLRTRSEHCPLA